MHAMFAECLENAFSISDPIHDIAPPPDLVNGELEYEVEAIVTHKPQGQKNLYVVKWKGYPTSDNCYSVL